MSRKYMIAPAQYVDMSSELSSEQIESIVNKYKVGEIIDSTRYGSEFYPFYAWVTIIIQFDDFSVYTFKALKILDSENKMHYFKQRAKRQKLPAEQSDTNIPWSKSFSCRDFPEDQHSFNCAKKSANLFEEKEERKEEY